MFVIRMSVILEAELHTHFLGGYTGHEKWHENSVILQFFNLIKTPYFDDRSHEL